MILKENKKSTYVYCMWKNHCVSNDIFKKHLCCNECTDKRCDDRCKDCKETCKYKVDYNYVLGEIDRLKAPRYIKGNKIKSEGENDI